MDPLCHTLVGAALAGTRLGERSWGAKATLVVAANLPDVDVVSYAWGSDAALLFRRGWTHGFLAQAVLPLVLAGAVVAVGRRRGAVGVHPGWLVALAYLGLLTHPFLDGLNTYGMRWWMPFDGAWSYGDALFIVDPWLWLVLGGAAFLRFSRTRRAVANWAAVGVVTSYPVLSSDVPDAAKAGWGLGIAALAVARGTAGWTREPGRRACAVGLTLATGYVTAMVVAALAAERAVASSAAATAAATSGATPPVAVFVGPVPADPTRRDVLLVDLEPRAYRPGVHRWGHGLETTGELIPVGAADPRVALALGAPCALGMRTWLRYPFYVVEERPDGGALVHLVDARYARAVRPGFGVWTVRLSASGRVEGCG